jgi:pantoate--beta-alanine ligase
MSELPVVETAGQMKALRQEWLRAREAVGFIPTMGALHEGHMSLIRASRSRDSRVVVSIFVNPTQFNDKSDLANYPRPIEQDLKLLTENQVDAVFMPSAAEMYADQFNFEVHEKSLSQLLCGPGRPGHFDGMLTVVLKLLGIVGATRAYFGEKDFQQLRLIQEMVKAFFIDTEIVPCPTLREPDGLAMSSRNLRLTAEQRRLAPEIFQALTNLKTTDEVKSHLHELGFRVEYVSDQWNRRFVAAHLGQVRLIDNVAI